MSERVSGLLSSKGEFSWAVALLIVAPLLPLPIEMAVKGGIEPATLFLTAALYTISQAFTVRSLGLLLSGSVFAGMLLVGYGLSIADTSASGLSEHLPSEHSTEPNRFATLLYYASFAVMGFFAFHQWRFRYRLHIVAKESFFEFDRP
jgi:hypothetical protein